jgi:hypothetical protein
MPSGTVGDTRKLLDVQTLLRHSWRLISPLNTQFQKSRWEYQNSFSKVKLERELNLP